MRRFCDAPQFLVGGGALKGSRKPPPKRLRDALDVIAAHLNGSLEHGAVLEGRLALDGLDVELSLRAREAVGRDELAELRERALEVIATCKWQDSCDCSVKDRSRWAFSSSKTKGCEKPIVAVVVLGPYRQPHFSFRCRTHIEHHLERDAKLIKATIELSPAALAAARAKRKHDDEERARYLRMTEIERIARDAELEGRADAAAEILNKGQGGS